MSCGCRPTLDSLTREMNLERRIMARKLRDLEMKSKEDCNECKVEDDYKDSPTVKLRRSNGKLEADLNVKNNSLLSTEGGLSIDKESLKEFLEMFLENECHSVVRDAFGESVKLELEKD